MVRHHLQGNELYRTIVAGNGEPTVFDCLSQGRQLYMGRILRTRNGITAANHFSEVFLSSFSNHRYHIHSAIVVVMVNTPSLHRRFLLSGEGVPSFKLFLIHDCKVTKKRGKNKTNSFVFYSKCQVTSAKPELRIISQTSKLYL